MWDDEKKLIVDTCLKLVRAGYTVGTAGNVSLRLKGNRELLAVTPSSRDYETLQPSDVQIVDFEGNKVEGELAPSIEVQVHAAIYRQRPSVNAVIHTHSVHATTVAVCGQEIPALAEDQVAFLGGDIKLARYALSQTPELAINVAHCLAQRNACLLQNHGAVGIGRTMTDALTACQTLEKTAQIFVQAQMLGMVNEMPAEAIDHARGFFLKSAF